MLQGFQSEWDALMLEVFTLKQQLTAAQQELSNAMYQQDAAQRVIARLLKEREHYKSELSAVRSTSVSENGMDVDHDASSASSSKSVLPSALVKRIEAKTAELSASREKRRIGPAVATRTEVPNYSSLSHQSPHKTGGVNALDVVVVVGGEAFSATNPEELVVTGGADKSVIVLEKSSGKKIATLSGGFKKGVSAVRALSLSSSDSSSGASSSSSSSIRVVAASDDGNISVWDAPSTSPSTFSLTCTIRAGSSTITSLDVHPVGDLVLVGLDNGSFTMVDVSTQTSFPSPSHEKLPSSVSVTDVKFHPDGEIFATASSGGAINVWAVASFEHMASFDGHSASVVALSFSENGISLASASEDQTLRVWDLQEVGQVQITQLGAKPTALGFDLSGRFLAVAISPAQAKASREIRVFTGRKCDLVATYELDAQKDVHALRWGHNAKSFVFAQDKSVHFWGPSAPSTH